MSSLSEYEIHCSIVEYLQLTLPPDTVLHHSPNEGRHNVAFRAKQKRLGMQAGWPDLELLVPRRYWRHEVEQQPIFFEVKSHKGKQSKAQRKIAEKLGGVNAHYFVVRSIDEVAEALLGKLKPSSQW